MLPTRDVLGILVDNLEKRGCVFPLSQQQATRWADGLGIPRGGSTVLYTGLMYQLGPYIAALVDRMAKLENSRLTRLFWLGRDVNRIMNLSRFLAFTSRKKTRAAESVLRNIARLLTQAEVAFGYLYGDELYSGALAYDQGADDVFEKHAQKVHDVLRAHGTRRVITVDPHTTNMLRSVYPKVLDAFDIEVKSYLEVLAERDMKPTNSMSTELVTHDSCVYARYEDVISQPRTLLVRAGARVREPVNAGRYTLCCGGPIESLFPGAALEVAERRVGQLADAGSTAVTMCPLCLLNLRKAADSRIAISDISEYLVEAYCEEERST